MLETEKQTNKLYKTLNTGYEVQSLFDETEVYCKKYNKDLRVYLLGLKLAENQDNTDEFLDNFYSYIGKIEDYKSIWSEFTLELLGNQDFGVINEAKGFNEVEKSIQEVINLLEQYGDDIPEATAWLAARSATRSARSAARSARSAAWSAAESATESAWLATRSAWSAARSARLAAESAAESATESAWLAVASVRYKELGNCYIEILERRVNAN